VTETAAIVAFLAARLDEDRAVAREAAGLHWVAEEPAIGIVLVDGEPLIEGHITGLTAHIARHDPVRVLRDVEAKRAILRRCGSRMNEPDQWPNGLVSPRAVLARQNLMDLAAVYSDHADYRAEDWAPKP
jgi:hypothetical protein